MSYLVVIRDRADAQLHLGQSRLWNEPGYVPARFLAGRPRRVLRRRGLPVWLPDGEAFAPRRAAFAPRRAKP